MGLFGLFGKKAAGGTPPAPAEKKEELFYLEDYAGMQAEVSDSEGQPLFVAKLLGVQETQAELHQITPPSREITEPLAIQIRGYNVRNSKAAYLSGTLLPAEEDSQIWKAENLTLIKLENDRSFFRMDMDLDARMTPVGQIGAVEEPCKLLNISVGGVRIGSANQYNTGDRLLLSMELAPEKGPSTVLCQILRVVQQGSGYEYGCRFIELNEADEERIMQIIFNLQRKKSGRS